MNRFTLAFAYQLANASSPEDAVPSVIVHFADLALTQIDSVKVLYRRPASRP